MFKYMTTKEQLLEEKRKNEKLQAQLKDLEDATVELAEVISESEVAING